MSCNKLTADSVSSRDAYHVKIEIPGLPKPTNQLIRRHWSFITKEKKTWYQAVKLSLVNIPDKPLTKARLRFGRHSTTSPDYDGLVSSFKWVCDGLVDAGVIIDDNMKVIGVPEFYWEKAKRGKGFITVEVTEVL